MSRKPTYDVDYSFFEVDSPELWYFIGFVYADGCLCKDKLSICLAVKDKDFLKGLVGRFSDAPLHEYERKKDNKSYVRWMISRVKLASILRGRFDLRERKTFNLGFPEIPSEYLRDFVRGYFDGDGGWVLTKSYNFKDSPFRKFRFYAQIVCGDRIFIEWLRGVIQGWGCRIGKVVKHSTKEAYYIRIENMHVQRFVRCIYYEGCLCLKRKADKYFDVYGIKIA